MQALQDPLLEHGLLPYMATKCVETKSIDVGPFKAFTYDEPLATDKRQQTERREYREASPV